MRGIFARAPFVEHLGLRIVSLSEGAVETVLDVRDELRQQDGFVHAGVLASIADHTAGACAATHPRAAVGTEVLSITFTVALLRPALGPRLRCVARAVRVGRSVAVVDADVTDESEGGRSAHVTHATVTLALRAPSSTGASGASGASGAPNSPA